MGLPGETIAGLPDGKSARLAGRDVRVEAKGVGDADAAGLGKVQVDEAHVATTRLRKRDHDRLTNFASS